MLVYALEAGERGRYVGGVWRMGRVTSHGSFDTIALEARRYRALMLEDGVREVMTVAEGAAFLRLSRKTLKKHIDDGDIAVVLVGKGKIRPRKRLLMSDVQAFLQQQRKLASCPCPSLSPRTRRSTITISGAADEGFMALLDAETRLAQKKSRVIVNSKRSRS
jgi:hypothetical protein